MKTITEAVSFARGKMGGLRLAVLKVTQGIWCDQISEKESGGGITIDGDVDLQGTSALYGHKNNVVTVTDDTTLTAADSGKIYLVGTNDKTITLPATAAGVQFTFINIGSGGNNNLKVDPNASDKIAGLIVKPEGGNADATTDNTLVSVIDGGDGDYVENTKNTAQTGDRMTIVGDGDAGWYITEGLGIWAHE